GVGNYADVLPADVLLLCGIFGNVSEGDIQRTAQAAPALCAPGATVIWTRHRRPPDLTPRIRAWFRASGFDEVAFDTPDTKALTGVGVGPLARPRPRGPAAGPAFPLPRRLSFPAIRRPPRPCCRTRMGAPAGRRGAPVTRAGPPRRRCRRPVPAAGRLCARRRRLPGSVHG